MVTFTPWPQVKWVGIKAWFCASLRPKKLFPAQWIELNRIGLWIAARAHVASKPEALKPRDVLRFSPSSRCTDRHGGSCGGSQNSYICQVWGSSGLQCNESLKTLTSSCCRDLIKYDHFYLRGFRVFWIRREVQTEAGMHTFTIQWNCFRMGWNKVTRVVMNKTRASRCSAANLWAGILWSPAIKRTSHSCLCCRYISILRNVCSAWFVAWKNSSEELVFILGKLLKANLCENKQSKSRGAERMFYPRFLFSGLNNLMVHVVIKYKGPSH